MLLLLALFYSAHTVIRYESADVILVSLPYILFKFFVFAVQVR